MNQIGRQPVLVDDSLIDPRRRKHQGQRRVCNAALWLSGAAKVNDVLVQVGMKGIREISVSDGVAWGCVPCLRVALGCPTWHAQVVDATCIIHVARAIIHSGY